MKIPLLLLLIAWLAGCAGVFTNPDLKSDAAALSHSRIRNMAESPPMELQILAELRDTGFATIPESDFFLLQDFFLNSVVQFHRPGLPFSYFSDAKTGITQPLDLDHPRFPPAMFVSQLSALGFCIYEVQDCPAPVFRALIINNLPLLLFGPLHYKKISATSREARNLDDERGLSLTADETGRRILRRLEMFDVVYGYSRLQGETRKLPGEEGPEYLYETRSNLNFRAFDQKPLLNQSLPLYGKPGPGNYRIIQNLYLVLPDTANLPALNDKITETAAGFGFKDDWKKPVKVD